MQRYEIKKYFGKNYASTCQHCGITIYKRNKNGNGKHAWFAYSRAAYRADTEFEVLCRGCYDEAVKKYGPMISREEILRKIDKTINKWVAKQEREQKQQRQGEELEREGKVEKVELANTSTSSGTSFADTSSVTHESFKPYPIYTRENVNSHLRAYRKAKKIKQQSSQPQNSQHSQQLKLINSDDFYVNETTVRIFLNFITGFTVGARMTKRPVMLDAAHKYIGRWVSDGHADTDLRITDFFDSMAELGMIRKSVAKKARNICYSISKTKSDSSDGLVIS